MNAKRFYQGSPDTSEETVYTVPEGKTAIIKEIVVCNTTNTEATLTLSVVPKDDSANDANRLLAGKEIDANDLVVFALSTVMDEGDFISVQQGTGSALTVTISGLEF